MIIVRRVVTIDNQSVELFFIVDNLDPNCIITKLYPNYDHVPWYLLLPTDTKARELSRLPTGQAAQPREGQPLRCGEQKKPGWLMITSVIPGILTMKIYGDIDG